MTLILYMHPLASFCHKVLIALYEQGTPFEPRLVNLGVEAERAAFMQVWPLGKFPVLRDTARERTVPESSIINEYLEQHYPGAQRLLPASDELALQVRLWDRFFDLYVNEAMQKVVTDKLRPPEQRDALGVEQARHTLRNSYAMIASQLAERSWIVGDSFTLADCAAAPALYYANLVEPIPEAQPRVSAYLERLSVRPSFARVLREAAPYFSLFPG